MGAGGNPEVDRIMAAYEAMLPESSSNWPGMGTGIAAVIDHVRRVTAPVVFGTVSIEVWKGLRFESDRKWWSWCREDRQLSRTMRRQLTTDRELLFAFCRAIRKALASPVS